MAEERSDSSHVSLGPHTRAKVFQGPVLDALLDTIDEYLILNGDGSVLFASSSAASHFGWSVEEIQSFGHQMPGLKLFRPDGSPMPREETASYRAIAEQRVVRDVMVGIRPYPDVTYWLRTAAAPLREPDGVTTGAVVVFRDVTDAIESELARQRSEVQFRALFERSPIPAYLWRSDGTVLRLEACNDAAVANTRGLILPVLGKSAGETMAGQPQVLEALERCLAGRCGFEEEVRYRFRSDGEEHLYDAWFTFVPPDLVLVYTEDITERRRAHERESRIQEALTQTHDLLLALSEAAQNVQRARTPEAVYQTIADELEARGWHALVLAVAPDRQSMTVAHVSIRSSLLRTAERLVGLTTRNIRIPLAPDGFFSRSLEFRESVFCERATDLFARGLPRLGRTLLERVVGMLGMEQMVFAPMIDGEDIHMLAIGGTGLSQDDIPAVNAFAGQAAIALRNAQLFQRQRDLAQQLVTVQEEERRRLADALHDQAGQSLTALRLRLELLAEELPEELVSVRQRLGQAAQGTRSIMDQLRQVAFDLRPPMLDAVGLRPALESLCQSLCDESHLKCTHSLAEVPPLPDAVNVTLYRFLQEALTNVAKHADAQRIQVELGMDSGAVVLSVADDGVGMDASVARRRPGRAGGLGLPAIRERLEGLGGHLQLESEPGNGTRLAAVIPVRDL